MRLQFPLYKMFLIFAAYAAALGALRDLGGVGIGVATCIGAAAAMLIIVTRTKDDVLSVIITATGSLIGAFFSFVLVSPVNMRYTVADYVRDCIVASAGATVGGLFFSWASKR